MIGAIASRTVSFKLILTLWLVPGYPWFGLILVTPNLTVVFALATENGGSVRLGFALVKTSISACYEIRTEASRSGSRKKTLQRSMRLLAG